MTHVQWQQGPNRICAAEECSRADEGVAHDWFSQRVGEADAHCRAEWLGWDIDCRLRAGEGQQEAGDHNNEANETALAAKAAVAPATARSSPPSAGPMARAGLPFAP